MALIKVMKLNFLSETWEGTVNSSKISRQLNALLIIYLDMDVFFGGSLEEFDA